MKHDKTMKRKYIKPACECLGDEVCGELLALSRTLITSPGGRVYDQYGNIVYAGPDEEAGARGGFFDDDDYDF